MAACPDLVRSAAGCFRHSHGCVCGAAGRRLADAQLIKRHMSFLSEPESCAGRSVTRYQNNRLALSDILVIELETVADANKLHSLCGGGHETDQRPQKHRHDRRHTL